MTWTSGPQLDQAEADELAEQARDYLAWIDRLPDEQTPNPEGLL